MGIVTSKDGTKIAFEKTGNGPALVMIDPAGGSHAFRPMQEVIPLLSTDFTVYTYDRRGRGDSTDTLPYSADREVDDLEAIINAAGEDVFAYGFSSGAVLALLGAAHGLSIKKLVLLEPPLIPSDQIAPPSDLELEIAELVAKGQRREAFVHFHDGIGVPPEITANQQKAPYWAALEAMAHTLVYDLTVTRSLPTPQLAAITPPTLVIDSAGTGEEMYQWCKSTADALPNGSLMVLEDEWHGVAPDVLAPLMKEFFWR